MTFPIPRFNQSGLLFVPKRWQRPVAIRWLKRVHAWTGFWGALLFLMMGTSGFLLNHRAILKIGGGDAVEVSAMDIVVPGPFASAEAMAAWAKQALNLRVDAKPPRGEGPGGGRRFLGKKLPQPEKWTRVFNLPDGRVTVDYVPGAAFVSARRESVGVIGTIKNLHKGVGLGVAWVLFLDTIAGALVAMSLTGFLLWTRLHGARLAAGVIVLASLGVAAAAVVPLL